MTCQCKIIQFKRKKSAMETVNRVLNISCVTLSIACIAVNVSALCCALMMGGR